MAYDADERPVVVPFGLGLTYPGGQIVPRDVFALHHNAITVGCSKSAYVAFIFRASLYAAIYPIVAERVFEVVGDLAFERCSGLFRGS